MYISVYQCINPIGMLKFSFDFLITDLQNYLNFCFNNSKKYLNIFKRYQELVLKVKIN